MRNHVLPDGQKERFEPLEKKHGENDAETNDEDLVLEIIKRNRETKRAIFAQLVEIGLSENLIRNLLNMGEDE